MRVRAGDPSFTIRPITSFDVDGALSVLEAALGAGYITREALARYVTAGPRRGFVAAAAGSVVGVVTADLPSTESELTGLFPADQLAAVRRAIPELGVGRTGLLHSIAVSPQHREHGLATGLAATAVESLEQAGATHVLSVGWTDGDGCHIQRTLERLGFTARGDIADYWTADSLAAGYSCPTCGSPCHCTARLFSCRL